MSYQPSPPKSGISKKVLFGGLGAAGCLVVVVLLLIVGGIVFYLTTRKPRVERIYSDYKSSPSPAATSTPDGRLAIVAADSPVRTIIKTEVGRFELKKIEKYNHVDLVKAGATEGYYAEFSAPGSAYGVSHLIAYFPTSSQAAVGLKNLLNAEIPTGYRIARRDPMMAEGRQVGERIVLLNHVDDTPSKSDVVIWTNGPFVFKASSVYPDFAEEFQKAARY